jgi:methylenetetrahydrofolate/methylenetetrahydromethanopterin dehydrogenase (NADP+)
VLVPPGRLHEHQILTVAIDLNAVPPLGIDGIEATDKGQLRDGVLRFGAIGVGGLKMKIHKRSIQRLFEANDLVLDAESILELAINEQPDQKSAGSP